MSPALSMLTCCYLTQSQMHKGFEFIICRRCCCCCLWCYIQSPTAKSKGMRISFMFSSNNLYHFRSYIWLISLFLVSFSVGCQVGIRNRERQTLRSSYSIHGKVQVLRKILFKTVKQRAQKKTPSVLPWHLHACIHMCAFANSCHTGESFPIE